MIKAEARYFNNAHRISDYVLDSAVTTLYDGQWLEFSDAGVLKVATGAKAAFLTTSSKWGNPTAAIGVTIHEGPAGRDTVTVNQGKVVILAGPYRLATDQFDKTVPLNTYTAGCDLTVNATGVVKPATGTDRVVATCAVPPASSTDFITIIVK